MVELGLSEKAVVYAGLLCFSYNSWRFSGRVVMDGPSDALTTCAFMPDDERAAHRASYAAHGLYFLASALLVPSRDLAYAVHHVVTLFLVGASWTLFGTGGIRFGTAIMFCHGATDIALTLTRMVPSGLLKIAVGIGFLGLWAVFRVLVIARMVHAAANMPQHQEDFCELSDRFIWAWRGVVALLGVLWGLNVYWFGLIIKKLASRIEAKMKPREKTE